MMLIEIELKIWKDCWCILSYDCGTDRQKNADGQVDSILTMALGLSRFFIASLVCVAWH